LAEASDHAPSGAGLGRALWPNSSPPCPAAAKPNHEPPERLTIGSRHVKDAGQAQDELEGALVDELGEALADLGPAGVVGRRLVGPVAEEVAQGAAVGAAPGDAALGVEAREVADEEHAGVGAGRDAGAADAVGVAGAAEVLDAGVEAGLVWHTGPDRRCDETEVHGPPAPHDTSALGTAHRFDIAQPTRSSREGNLDREPPRWLAVEVFCVLHRASFDSTRPFSLAVPRAIGRLFLFTRLEVS
jgi:hypothetical protein